MFGEFDGEGDEVVFANWDQFNGVGEFIGFRACVNVHGDELLGFLGAYWGDRGEEVDELVSVVTLCIEEVESVFGFADVDCVFVGGVLEDELFEVEEGSFVGNFLADLDDSAPGIGSEGLGAVRTLVVVHHVFHFKRLLQDRSLESFLLDSNLDLDSPRMGLCPYKACVNYADF